MRSEALRDTLLGHMARDGMGVREGAGVRDGAGLRDEATFNALALEVFRHQVEANPVYGSFVRGRIPPEEVKHWTEIPLVPVRAFKELPAISGPREGAAATFLSSGTTGGPERRSEHRVRDLELYRSAALSWGRPHLHPDPDGSGPIRVLALLPSPEARPDSSLARMAGFFADAWGDGEGEFLADAEFAPELDRLPVAVVQAADQDVPVLLLGTAFAFAHLLEGGAPALPLPERSVIMETGGYKGRARERPRHDLYRDMAEHFRIPLTRIVNEYGMTELLSQFYEPVLREDGPTDPAERRHLPPPWVRTRILDPVTLDPVSGEEPGLLAHLDLANLHSVSAILTEDLGVAVKEGFRVLGRNPGAEPRGCSLAMEELLR